MIHAKAYIYDNRDGSVEVVGALGVNFHDADVAAFNNADERCKHRNPDEGWTRFVPLWVRRPEGLSIKGR